MKGGAFSAMLAGTFGLAGGAYAQLSPAFRSACPEAQTLASWCPAQLSQQGWTLKYKSESPQDLMDAYWRYEVWTREGSAALCEFNGGRGGPKANRCIELSEVGR